MSSGGWFRAARSARFGGSEKTPISGIWGTCRKRRTSRASRARSSGLPRRSHHSEGGDLGLLRGGQELRDDVALLDRGELRGRRAGSPCAGMAGEGPRRPAARRRREPRLPTSTSSTTLGMPSSFAVKNRPPRRPTARTGAATTGRSTGSVEEGDLGGDRQVDQVFQAALDLEEPRHHLDGQHLEKLVPVLLLQRDPLFLDGERAVQQAPWPWRRSGCRSAPPGPG